MSIAKDGISGTDKICQIRPYEILSNSENECVNQHVETFMFIIWLRACIAKFFS